MDVEIKWADAGAWDDVLTVLGVKGGYSGCWCMFWRLTNEVIHDRTAAQNELALRELVTSGTPVGVLAYHDRVPVGWCQVAPRPNFPRLFHTRGLGLRDPADTSVWSIVCVYLTRPARGGGVSDALVRGAVEFAAAHGARAVEGYPVARPDLANKAKLSSGTQNLFRRAGFSRTDPAATGSHVVMRLELPATR